LLQTELCAEPYIVCPVRGSFNTHVQGVVNDGRGRSSGGAIVFYCEAHPETHLFQLVADDHKGNCYLRVEVIDVDIKELCAEIKRLHKHLEEVAKQKWDLEDEIRTLKKRNKELESEARLPGKEPKGAKAGWELDEIDAAKRALEPAKRIVERLEIIVRENQPAFHFDSWDIDLAEFLNAIRYEEIPSETMGGNHAD